MQYLKTNSITLVFYDYLAGKTNCRNTAVFQSCFSFYYLHGKTNTYLIIRSSLIIEKCTFKVFIVQLKHC